MKNQKPLCVFLFSGVVILFGKVTLAVCSPDRVAGVPSIIGAIDEPALEQLEKIVFYKQQSLSQLIRVS